MEKSKKTAGIALLVILIGLMVLFGILSLVGLGIAFANQDATYIALAVVCGPLFFVLLIFTLVLYIGGYNRFVTIKNKVAESLSLVDVHLKLRFDLVPNLVEVVKGYMKHEKDVLTTLVALRNQALEAKNENQKIEVANQLVSQMNKVFAVAENYPDLKSNKLFLTLMEDLRDIENKIAASRRFYNANINTFNNLVQKFPSSLVAGMFGYTTQPLFQIEVNERVLPKINLSI